MFIRPVLPSDQLRIKEFFLSDVYHGSQWIRSILWYGIVCLFAKPIALGFIFVYVVGSCWDAGLGFLLAKIYLLMLVTLFSVKTVFFIGYFWTIPEFSSNKLADFYSQKGFAFFVAEIEGKIVGCVGVQKERDQVELLRLFTVQ